MNLKYIIFILGILYFVPSHKVKAQVLEPHWWQTDGTVRTLLKDSINELVYIGGSFNVIGPSVPYRVLIDAATGLPDYSLPEVNGKIYSAIPDGNSGWYLAGDFSRVGNVTRQRLAQLDSLGNVTSFFSDTSLVINGSITNLQKVSNEIFFSGNFTALSHKLPFGAEFNMVGGPPNLSFPRVNGLVSAVISDGSGGWYIAGEFTKIGDSLRTRLAHVNSLGVVTPWNPFANDRINKLIKIGNTIYALGDFDQIGGQARNYIAAIDSSTGFATSWDPNPNQKVHTLAISGNTVYVGGDFTSIGGQSRNRIAALDISTAVATTWNPNANNSVFAILADGNIVYAGGSFTSIGGQARNRIAAIDTNTGNATFWNPNSNNTVKAFALNGTTLYVGGSFTNIGVQNRNRIAALNTSNGYASSWNPDSDGQVLNLELVGNNILISGGFSIIGGQQRKNFAEVSIATGNSTPLNLHLNFGAINDFAFFGNTLYVGGTFESIGGIKKVGIASVDAVTGAFTSWSANANGYVNSFFIDGNLIYVGGNFTNIGGQARNNIAALDLITGIATSWNPSILNGFLNKMVLNGNTLYVAGNFQTINGQTRKGIGAIDINSGAVLSWNPNLDIANVNNIKIKGNSMFIGGFFLSVNGQPRTCMAAVDLTSALPTPFNPNADATVHDFVFYGDTIYVTGGFTNIGGQNRYRAAALNANTGNATSWDPNPNDNIYFAGESGGKFLLSGDFTSIFGIKRRCLAALDANTGMPTFWNPGIDGPGNITVRSLVKKGDTIFVGGDFTSVGGQTRNRLAAIDAITGLPTLWNPNSNSMVTSMGVSGNIIFAGGNFTTIGGQTRNRIAALDAITGIPTSWNPDANNSINTMAIFGNTLFVGGSFTSIGGQTRNSIAALDIGSGLPTSWDPDANGPINSMQKINNSLYVAGPFTNIGGQLKTRLAALDLVTGNSTNWPPPHFTHALGSVITHTALGHFGKNLLVGGSFTAINGQFYNYIGALDTLTGEPDLWNPGVIGINIIHTSDSNIFIGGSFKNVGGEPRKGLAVFSNPAHLYTGSVSTSPICAGATITVPFSTSKNCFPGNNFRIELSDASGSFANSVNIGTLAGVSADTITAIIPANTPSGTGYRVRVASSSPPVAGTDNGANINIYGLPPVTLPNFPLVCINSSPIALSGGMPLGGTYSGTGVSGGNFDPSIIGAGTDTITYSFTDANGCTNAAVEAITVNNPVPVTLDPFAPVCENEVAFILSGGFPHGGVYSGPGVNGGNFDPAMAGTGIHTVTYTFNNGCIDSDQQSIEVKTISGFTINSTDCNSYTYNGQTYFQSGSYFQYFTNSVGCDSIITLNLIINSDSFDSLVYIACDEFALNGQTYTSSGIYNQTLTNVTGCDSTITLDLTILYSSSSFLTPFACDSFSINGQTYTSSGIYTQIIPNALGCDSIIEINLTIQNAMPLQLSVDSMAICTKKIDAGPGYQNYYWSGGQNSQDILITQTGNYIVTVEDGNGCMAMDSIFITMPNCSFVYPGDANNDLIANNFDILTIGINFGETGPPRDSISNHWIGHNALDWQYFQLNNNNMKFVDCNGDGSVDYNDTLAINLNFGSTYTRSGIFSASGIPLILSPLKNSYVAGDTVVIDIIAGNSTNDVSNIYGLAFNLSTSTGIIKENSGIIDFNGWITPPGGRISFQYFDYQTGTVYFALSRIDKTDISGFGKIASVKFIADESIVSEINMNWSFTRIEAITIEADTIDFTPMNAEVVIKPNPTNVYNRISESLDFILFPNPANNEITFLINSPKKEVSTILIYNSVGALVASEKLILEKGNNSKNYSLQNYASGIYQVILVSGEEKIMKRFVRN